MPPSRPTPDPHVLLLHDAFLRRVAGGLVAQSTDADDLVQATYERALAAGVRADQPVRAWLRVIAQRLAWRRGAREAGRPWREARARPAQSVPTPAEVLEREDLRGHVVRAVLALSERDREVLVLRYLEDLSLMEVAATLGLPTETVRTRQKRALARLRAKLERDHPGTLGALALLLPGASHAVSLSLVGGVVVKKALVIGVVLLLIAGGVFLVDRDPPAPVHPGRGSGSMGPPQLVGRASDDETPPSEHVDAESREAAEAEHPLLVRDLGTGEVVVGVPLFGQTGGQRIQLGASIADGGTTAEAGELETIRIESEYWTQATTSVQEAIESGTIWVYGPMRLRVRVEDERGKALPAEDVELHLLVLQPPGTGLNLLSAPPWNTRWYRSHGIRKTYPLRADSTGLVPDGVPRLRYLGVRARIRGRRSELVELVVPSASEPHVPVLVVRIRVQPTPKVTGVVVDQEGQHVSGAVVKVSVFRDIPFEEADPSRVREPDGGMTICGNRDGTATVMWSTEVVTGEDGEYSISVSQSGRVVLQALKHDFIPYHARILLGETTTSHDVNLEPDGDYPTFLLLWEGRPLPAQELTAGDITDLREQTNVGVTVDERGRIRDGWLRPGRHYALLFALPAGASGANAMGRASRFIAWHGDSEIELSSLHTNLTRFKASTR